MGGSMRAFVHALAGAAALALSAPAHAQTSALAPGEIALHISAQGAVSADFATFEVRLVGRAVSRAEAESDLREAERKTASTLENMGIDRSRLVLSDASFSEEERYDWRGAGAMADAAANAEASAVYVVDIADETEALDEPPRITVWVASSTMTVTVDDLAKLENAMRVSRGEETITSPRPTFRFRDDAKSEREAVSAAIAEAKADAEVYADALGYRLVRIVAVSNDGPPLSLPSVLQAMATIDNPSRDWSLIAQRIATVGIDFAIAPK